MDKEFEKKVKMKRIRTAAVAVIVIAVIAYLVLDMDVEKADYGDSLQEQIETAQSLYNEQKANAGNEEGQYAPYTLLSFEQQIEKAKAVAEDEASEYNAEKDAYEQLKEDVRAFKKSENSDVISADDAKKLAKEKGTETRSVTFKEDKALVYTIAGADLKKPATMNLTAQEEGPYYSQISEILAELSLQGQVVSFYQDGSFGGKISVTAPMYLEKETKAYAYKVDLEKGTLEYVSDAKLDKERQTAAFSVSEGGDYVIVTKKMHKDGKKKTLDIEELEEAKKDADSKDGNDNSENNDSTSNNDGDSVSDNPSKKPEAKNITVSIEIRCDTLAEDLSKLENPALEAYVPADGTILATTKVTVKEGSTVFDVLNKVCRDKKIHLETSYTPAFGSYYVEGINYLYEFDGGSTSGWEYRVNGWYPNYGSSEYVLKDGDSIVWAYTCNLGQDIGDSMPK